jgi:hypothetical protein
MNIDTLKNFLTRDDRGLSEILLQLITQRPLIDIQHVNIYNNVNIYVIYKSRGLSIKKVVVGP